MTDSAGQAAVHIATYAARVTLLVRGRSLADSMSKYLLRAIQSAPNIAVRYNVEVVGAAGHGRLERLTLKDRESGEAGSVRGRRRPPSVGEARGVGGGRGLDRDPPDPRPPALRLT